MSTPSFASTAANRTVASHTLTCSSAAGSHSSFNWVGDSSRALPPLASKMPPRCSSAREVSELRASWSAMPELSASHPYWRYQRTANRVSESRSDSCSPNTSSRVALMSCSASLTLMSDPSASRTLAYRENTEIPGPMAAWARSTGAMAPCMRVRSASGSSDFSAATKARRATARASAGRGRQARRIEDARALVPWESMRFLSSLRMGQVAVISHPDWISPSNKVCQPVDEVPSLPLSCCL